MSNIVYDGMLETRDEKEMVDVAVGTDACPAIDSVTPTAEDVRMTHLHTGGNIYSVNKQREPTAFSKRMDDPGTTALGNLRFCQRRCSP
jgi:hypothetical protein